MSTMQNTEETKHEIHIRQESFGGRFSFMRTIVQNLLYLEIFDYLSI